MFSNVQWTFCSMCCQCFTSVLGNILGLFKCSKLRAIKNSSNYAFLNIHPGRKLNVSKQSQRVAFVRSKDLNPWHGLGSNCVTNYSNRKYYILSLRNVSILIFGYGNESPFHVQCSLDTSIRWAVTPLHFDTGAERQMIDLYEPGLSVLLNVLVLFGKVELFWVQAHPEAVKHKSAAIASIKRKSLAGGRHHQRKERNFLPGNNVWLPVNLSGLIAGDL